MNGSACTVKPACFANASVSKALNDSNFAGYMTTATIVQLLGCRIYSSAQSSAHDLFLLAICLGRLCHGCHGAAFRQVSAFSYQIALSCPKWLMLLLVDLSYMAHSLRLAFVQVCWNMRRSEKLFFMLNPRPNVPSTGEALHDFQSRDSRRRPVFSRDCYA